jgi:DNA polymerase-3 subunit beta
MIRRTQYACDLKTTRYALGGTYCEPLLTALSFTGTDGRVVAHQQIEATPANGLPEVSSAVIPAKAIKVLQGILPNTMDLVDVGFPNANWAHFRIGDTTLSTRLIEGRFPQWRNAIPSAKPAGKVAIDAGLLKAAVAKVETHISADSRRMTLAFEDDTLTLICRSPAGEATATLDVMWDESPIEVDVTPKNLVDMVKGLGDGAIPEFEIPAGEQPVVVKLEDTFLGLIYTLKRENQ